MRRPEGVLAVVGPTATGKSELAAALAERLGGEIVSADAFAVYRGFDAGTAKPGPDLLARAPHHLVDAREPTEPWSAGEFALEARRLCDDILARGRLPILAGGTGFSANRARIWAEMLSTEVGRVGSMDAASSTIRGPSPLAWRKRR